MYTAPAGSDATPGLVVQERVAVQGDDTGAQVRQPFSLAQALPQVPVRLLAGEPQFGEDAVSHPVQQVVLVGHVPVQRYQ